MASAAEDYVEPSIAPLRAPQGPPIDICHDAFGRRDDPALLLIMGLGAQMIAWEDDFCRKLAGRGFFVIRFDNRDIGRSTRLDGAPTASFLSLLLRQRFGLPIPAPYRLIDMAGDAIGLLDHLGLARAHVVGASMGGAIAQEMAIHWPERVASLTSIMSTTGDPSLPRPTRPAMRVLMGGRPRTLEDYVALHRATWTILRGPRFQEDAARDRARAERAFARGLNPDGVRRQLTAIVASGDRTTKLRGLRAPTLVVHGDADPLVRLAAGEATARAIPGARLLVLPGMGHALPEPYWDKLTSAIATHAREAEDAAARGAK